MLKSSWALALLLPVLLGATPVVERPVTDLRGLLSPEDTEAVSRELVALREQTGVQLAVLIIGTTGGEPIEDYALRAAEAWKGGLANRDNGLLYVLAVDDRRMRLEVGYGLEEYLPDDAVRLLLDAQGPKMREQDYRGAVLSIIQGVRDSVPDETGRVAARKHRGGVKSLFIGILLTSLVAGVLLGLCMAFWRNALGKEKLSWLVTGLLLVPVAGILFVATRVPEVPPWHTLGVYCALFAVFSLGAWRLRRRASQGVTLIISPLLSLGFFGVFGPPSRDLLELAIPGGLCSLFSAFFVQLSLGRLLDIVLGQGFGAMRLGSGEVWNEPLLSGSGSHTVRSSSSSASSSDSSSRDSSPGWSVASSSSSSSSFSSSSSSGGSWRGGGGSFGGGGASSSW